MKDYLTGLLDPDGEIAGNTVSLMPLSGGDINRAFRLDSVHGRYFVKTNDTGFAHAMFTSEKKGLELLRNKGMARCPDPLRVFKKGDTAGLILEWIERGSPQNTSWETFGQMLAQLHRTVNPEFGLDHDNFIGSLPQQNAFVADWADFYYALRIMPQIRMAIDGGLLGPSCIPLVESMFTRLSGELPDESPSLLHGDLWRGNLLFDLDGQPVLIDPAVYYGHREMDIAMMLLFGGFESGLGPYQASFPLPDHWQDRLRFYQLYYILVHVNLFGGHYIDSAMEILKYYGRY